jgi:uncharacterized protein (DUF2384 family)
LLGSFFLNLTASLLRNSFTWGLQPLIFDCQGKKDLQDCLVLPSTYKRGKKSLKTHESERIERLARIYASALELWRNQEDI